ncbi:MAG: hypothetical protein F9K30_21770, partial [Dechloromonas sp.]
MRILGLHFGHDAAAAVVVDGAVRSYVMRERHNRGKHAIGLTSRELDKSLGDAGLGWDEVDFVAVTSTQNVEMLLGLIDGFSLQYVHDESGPLAATMARLLRRDNISHEALLGTTSVYEAFRQHEAGDFSGQVYRSLLSEGPALDWASLKFQRSMEQFVILAEWANGEGLATIGRRSALRNEDLRRGFHYPIEVNWRGRTVPGAFVHHHAAHAASCFYWSGFENAAVLTHDGYAQGTGYGSGLFWYGEDGKLWPLWPHHLAIGGIYDYVAWKLGLGATGGAGKLMGLAPYGKPRFFRRRFVGNWFDNRAIFGDQAPAPAWWQHCVAEARRDAYDMTELAVIDKITAPINADIAASTQKLFEESYLHSVDTLRSVLENTGLYTRNICLSGGTALNCPSNTRVFNESAFTRVFVEPGCDDSGLAIGAAFFLEHNVLDRPCPAVRSADLPFLGVMHPKSDTDEALAAVADRVVSERPRDLVGSAAADLMADRVIAWYEGRSEVGPRALGHRSIFCDPRNAMNWERV